LSLSSGTYPCDSRAVRGPGDAAAGSAEGCRDVKKELNLFGYSIRERRWACNVLLGRSGNGIGRRVLEVACLTVTAKRHGFQATLDQGRLKDVLGRPAGEHAADTVRARRGGCDEAGATRRVRRGGRDEAGAGRGPTKWSSRLTALRTSLNTNVLHGLEWAPLLIEIEKLKNQFDD
jgi:hypothetical protein